MTFPALELLVKIAVAKDTLRSRTAHKEVETDIGEYTTPHAREHKGRGKCKNLPHGEVFVATFSASCRWLSLHQAQTLYFES